MWILIIWDHDTDDCEVFKFTTKHEAVGFLRNKTEEMWKDKRDDFDTGSFATVLARKHLWTLEEMKNWLRGENNDFTIHLKEI